jgi:putative hydrolase of the HAD superfamily
MATAAILFDLDDTLVVDEAAVEAALLATCVELQDRYGLEPLALARTVRRCARELWRAAPTLAYCRAIGISSAEGLWARFTGDDPQLQTLHAWAPTYRRSAWANALAAHGIRDTRVAEQLAEAFPAERRARHWTFPEVDAVLRELQSRYRLAVVTNGAPDLQREKLDGVGLAPYFAIITVSGEVSIGKPDPRIFAHTLARLGVPLAEAVMVGNDLTRDIRGARKAGITGIWVNRTGSAQVAGDTTPDAEIASLLELVQMHRGLPAILDEA